MVIKKNPCSHEIGAQRPSSTDSDRQESRQIAGSLALQSSEAKPFPTLAQGMDRQHTLEIKFLAQA